MTQFLQSNVSLVVGAVLLLQILGVRALTRDKDLRSDLRAAFALLVVFLALRAGEFLFLERLSDSADRMLRLCWMLTFAFGCIRFAVGVGLWAVRAFRATPTPKILRDVLSITLYALASLPILKATLQIDLAGLVATSAILSVVLGLAMQDTLGNLFAGLSLQLERPFEVGDVVSVGQHTGRIAQIGWRATRIETFRAEAITLPNNIIAKEAVKNFSRGAQPIGTDVYLTLSYRMPPNKVKGAVLDTLRELPGCLASPAPHCRTWSFDENGIRYQVRFFASNYDLSVETMEQLYTRLWYRFEADGLEVSLPHRVLQFREPQERRTQELDELLGLLGSVDLLALMRPEDLRTLASEVVPRRFGAGERVINEGAEGNTFYVVASGTVSVRTGRPEREIVQLGRGQYFGEMSLLTGEPRAASVVAVEEAVLIEIARPTFGRILAAHPELAKALADLLARRRTELKAVAQGGGALEATPEARRIFGRLRELFGLADA